MPPVVGGFGGGHPPPVLNGVHPVGNAATVVAVEPVEHGRGDGRLRRCALGWHLGLRRDGGLGHLRSVTGHWNLQGDHALLRLLWGHSAAGRVGGAGLPHPAAALLSQLLLAVDLLGLRQVRGLQVLRRVNVALEVVAVVLGCAGGVR